MAGIEVKSFDKADEVNDNFNNGLDQRDCCRILFLGATQNKINIKSFDSRICDIYRPFKDNYYEKYLISSHILSLKFDLTSLKSIPYYIRWLIHRKINLLNLSLIIIRTIVLIPLSYLKRLKYYL